MNEQPRRAEMFGEHGQFVYHYTTRDAGFAHIIPTGTMRFSSMAAMRDPVENKDWLEGLLAPITWPDEDVERVIELVHATLETTKILSLTLDSPLDRGTSAEYARGYARPRMWEQYAENHQGVCLVFDRATFHEHLMHLLPAHPETIAGEVVYANAPLESHVKARALDVTRLSVEGEGDIRAGLHAHIDRHSPELFFRKLEDWRSEREYRYLLLDQDAGVVAVPHRGLRGVIVGERFPSWQLAGAAAVCHDAGAVLRKMQWGPFPPGVFDPLAPDPLA
jgi:hypothetical protein